MEDIYMSPPQADSRSCDNGYAMLIIYKCSLLGNWFVACVYAMKISFGRAKVLSSRS
jgi:hypothetical protein